MKFLPLPGQQTLFFVAFIFSLPLIAGARRHRPRSFSASRRETAKHPRWNYHDVDAWGDIDETCLSGHRQSPIHIATHEAIMDPVLFDDPLQFVNYGGTFSGMLSNNGHTIMWAINASTADAPRIAGSGLGQPGFVLDQFNFHWGNEQPDSNSLGSEHVIDYRSAPMELHLIHHNLKYPSFQEAQTKSDGLAVLAFLFTPVDNSVLDGEYATIAALIPQIDRPSSSGVTFFAHFPKIIPLGMLRDGAYFRYDGSMTTPPCHETVVWTVFADRIPISENSLAAFRSGVSTDVATVAVGGIYETLNDNFRPIQRLYNRVVTTNSRDAQVPFGFSPPSARQASTCVHQHQSTLLLVTLLGAFFWSSSIVM